tara:strand:- start:1545 stop:1754 length:210 start_codon:yes stop_codon:yes gene_type:complete
MNYITYQKRLDYLVELIEKGQLNSPLEAAEKFNCSERTIRRMIKILCEKGFTIEYCKKTKKYKKLATDT